MFDVAVSCLVLTALLAYLNHRFVGLPISIGVMGIALLFSFVLLGLDKFGFSSLHDYEEALLSSIDFSDLLMQGMLSMLLFAAALQVDLSELKAFKWHIGALAFFGTVASALLVGFGLWAIVSYTGAALPFWYCLVFGALISPTDPIAVMGILKSAKAPKSVEIVIAGESLFNDGVGIVLFTVFLAVIVSGKPPTAGGITLLLLREAGGGIVFGLALGYLTYRMLKSIDSYQEEVLLTLAAVLGGYALATRLHVSGPLAMVVMGLIVGNHGRALAMSVRSRANLDTFWSLLDAMLNAVLFMLIGLEFLVIEFPRWLALPAIVVIAITLGARLLSVCGPIAVARGAFDLPAGAWKVLTWGGLRGGISVALALSLPAGRERDTVLALTYSVVVFSILVQGLTIRRLVRAQRWKS